MSESKKSGKRMSAPKTVKAKGTTKKVTVTEQRPSHSPQGLSEMLARTGITETELKGLISVGMKWASKAEEAQKASIERDNAVASMARSVSTVVSRLLPVVSRLEKVLDGTEKLSRNGSALVKWVVELLDANKVEIHEGFNAIVWAAGLKGVADTAAAQNGDPEGSKVAWAESVMQKKTQEAKVKELPPPRPETSGTKPVERPHHPHNKKGRHERKQEPLKASLAEQLKAKGHVPTAPQAE